MPRKKGPRDILIPAIFLEESFWGSWHPQATACLERAKELMPMRSSVDDDPRRGRDYRCSAPAFFDAIVFLVDDYLEDRIKALGRRGRRKKAERDLDLFLEAMEGPIPPELSGVTSWGLLAGHAILCLEKAEQGYSAGDDPGVELALREATDAIEIADGIRNRTMQSPLGTNEADENKQSRPEKHREGSRNTKLYEPAHAIFLRILEEHSKAWTKGFRPLGIDTLSTRIGKDIRKEAESKGVAALPTTATLRRWIRRHHDENPIPGFDPKKRRPRKKVPIS